MHKLRKAKRSGFELRLSFYCRAIILHRVLHGLASVDYFQNVMPRLVPRPFPIVVGSTFLVRRLHLTRSFASSPDSSPSDKSFLMLFNHLRFGIPLLLFQRTSITISCPHILLLFSVCAHTFLHFLGYFSHLRCPSNSFKIVHWPLFLSFCPQLPTTITDANKMAADKMFFLISKICFNSLL